MLTAHRIKEAETWAAGLRDAELHHGADVIAALLDTAKALPRSADGAALVPGMVIFVSSYAGVRRATVRSVDATGVTYSDDRRPGVELGGEPVTARSKLYADERVAKAAWPDDLVEYWKAPRVEHVPAIAEMGKRGVS